MRLKSSIGQWIRNKLGISQLEHHLKQRLQFLQAMLHFSVPEILIPDPGSLAYSKKQIAQRYGIVEFNPAIHKNDLMFQHHLLKRPDNLNEALFHYFNVGLEALNKIRQHLPGFQPKRLLDFGAGYGRGSRFLNHFFPDSEIYVSEVKPVAIDFQRVNFGFTPVFHSEDPGSFQTDWDFDLIIAISVFSHLPEQACRRWLKVLIENLNQNGVLIFTYHSISSSDQRDYEYIEQSEDMGLSWVPDRLSDTRNYGTAFYSVKRISEILGSLDLDFRLLPEFSGTQDAAICRLKQT